MVSRSARLLVFLLFVTPALLAAPPADIPKSSQQTDLSRAQRLLIRLSAKIRKSALDCSHLVHDLYSKAGLRYDYADSHKLFNGVPGFTRISRPRSGDLIVWRGHVGIVIDPEERSFLSKLRSGVKLSSYDSRYWKRRGPVRFLRYSQAGSLVVDVRDLHPAPEDLPTTAD